MDEIFPAVYPRPDVTQEIQEDVIDVVYERPTDYDEKIEEISFKAIEDIVEVKPEEVEEIKIVPEPAFIPTERIADRDEEEIDLIEEEFPIVQEPAVIPTERITDQDKEEIDLVEEEKFPIVQEPAIIPTERITDREKIDLVEEEELSIVQEPVIIPTERIADHDDEKLDLVKEEEIVQEAAVEKDYDEDRDEEKIDLIKEEELMIEPTVAEKIPVEEPEILDEDEIERVAKIELELPRELEEYCN